MSSERRLTTDPTTSFLLRTCADLAELSVLLVNGTVTGCGVSTCTEHSVPIRGNAN
jgi:hypothetical protein